MGAGEPDSPPPQPLRAPDLRDLRVADDVYEPAEDSFALVDALALALAAATAANTLPRVALEVGCGSGFVSAAVAAALSDPKSAYAVEGARVYATDCNPAACAATRALLAAHAPAAAADVRECDLEGALATELRGAVDLLVFNPPYVPSPEDEVGGPRIEAAWAGGERGRVVIDRLLPRVANLLSETGVFVLLTIAENEPDQILREAAPAAGLSGEVIFEKRAWNEKYSILCLRRARA